MSKTLPPLPALPPAEVQEWSESWITLRGEGWTRETVEKYASDYALAAIAAQGVPDCKVVDVGFRWDADRQEHVPSIKVEFAPVKANSQNDAKGWKDRDALAAMLAAAPPAPQPHPERQSLQAEGKHPAPCARFCEANAFKIEIRGLEAQLKALAHPQPAQEPVAWLEQITLSSGGYSPPLKEWRVTQNPSTSKAPRKPLYTSPQAAQPLKPDMFWNSDDADEPHDSIECFLNDQICQHDLEVGAVFTIWQAKKLPSVTIRVTAIDEEECEAEYEVVEQAHGITKGTT